MGVGGQVQEGSRELSFLGRVRKEGEDRRAGWAGQF